MIFFEHKIHKCYNFENCQNLRLLDTVKTLSKRLLDTVNKA